jgi:membrane peptidoglycan carboxypeptidase
VLLRSPSRSVREYQHRTRYEAQRKTLLHRMYDAGAIDRSACHKALQPPKIYPLDTPPIGIAIPQSVATAFRAIDPMLRQLDLGVTPQALRYQQPFPLHVRVSLHAELSWRFDAAMAPALDDPELKHAVVILVDGRPVVLFGGHLDLYHYVLQARRQVGSVSKMFFYDAVWQLGYLQPHTVVADGDMSESLRQRLSRPRYHPHNDDGRLRAPLAHHQSLSQSVNKIAYRTTWGERTQAQRVTIARTLGHRFAFPWYHVTDRSIRHFVHTFTADESVAFTWQATPFEVAGMLEHGFRGVSLSRDHLILSWNEKPVSQPNTAAERGLSAPVEGLARRGGRDGTPSCPSRSALGTRGQNRHVRWRARCLVGRLSPDRAANASGPDPSTDHVRRVGRRR